MCVCVRVRARVLDTVFPSLPVMMRDSLCVIVPAVNVGNMKPSITSYFSPPPPFDTLPDQTSSSLGEPNPSCSIERDVKRVYVLTADSIYEDLEGVVVFFYFIVA